MNPRFTCAPVWTPFALALAIGAAYSPISQAQAKPDATLPEVQVSGSRFLSDPVFAPLGATVISADEIRDAGIGNVNEAIRKLGNVPGRQGFTAPDNFSLDMRGFGANSDQNIVIMVDGVRLSENEQAAAQLSAVPIESVERIEIVRGGNSVLYGDGATGGTIQIITKKPQRNTSRASLFVEAGSFGQRAARATFSKAWDGLALDANMSRQDQEGYRRNNAVREENVSASLQKTIRGGRIGLRLENGTQDFRLPGALSLAAFQADPRATNTPRDFGSLDSRRTTLFGEMRSGELDFAAELSNREKASRQYGSFPYSFDTRTTQFSPRVRWLGTIAGLRNELVSGIDLTRWWRSVGSAIATQDAQAIYLRDELRLGRWRMAAGARHERFDKKDTGYQVEQSVNAWELQAAYAATGEAEVYAKLSKSYRIPNADDNAFLAKPLLPQTSLDIEVGAVLGDAHRKFIARVFRHKLSNEIFYDPTVFSNVNLDPTQREGFELEANLRIAPGVSLAGAFAHITAGFTAGANAGREMILVPRNTASLRVNWMPGGPQRATIGVRWTDEQRYGDDFSNACTRRIASYAVVDARYAYRSGPWEFAATGSNLANRSYFSNAFSCATGNVYPEAGRQVRLSLRRDF